MSDATALAPRRANVMMGNRGFEFDLDSTIRFAQGLVDAGMVPRGVSKPGAVVGLIEAGRELGLAPMYALSNLTFTNGRLGIMGDAAKALVRSRGVLKPGTDFEATYDGEPSTPTWKCTVTAWRDGQPQPFSASFSLQDAITAGLARIFNGKVQSSTRDGWGDSGPWAKYTERMLMYRALGFLCRDRFSEILGGAVLTEELRDYPTHNSEPLAPPVEPDPLLSADVIAPATQEATPAAETPISIVDADVVSEKRVSMPPPDEQATIRAIEKLEGEIVTAESIEALDAAWKRAASLRESLSPKQRKALTTLYQQNAAGLTVNAD